MVFRRCSATSIQRCEALSRATGATAGSGTLGCLLAQETGWAKHEYQNENSEDHSLRPARIEHEVTRAREKPDKKPPQHGPRDVANPAKHRRCKCHQPTAEALKEPGCVVVEAKDQPCRTCQCAANQES